MSKIYSLVGEQVDTSQVENLFSQGYPIYLISRDLGVPQYDVANVLAVH